ncbi:YncE family protein, partial [Nocardia nova]
PGEVLVAAGREVLRVDIATAAIRPVPVDGDVRAIARRGDGRLVAGLDGGRVQILDADGHPNKTISGLGTVDAVAATANAVATLDLDQTTLTELDLDRDRAGLALRAGLGATHVISDHYGRLLATDTSGGALLVYTTDPLLLRQRFPVGPSPYALAYDERSDTVWLTLSGSNEVVGFDLSTGIPEEVGRFATVRQPNSLTIDSRTGDMFVGSATGDGLQRIGADQRKRGQ